MKKIVFLILFVSSSIVLSQSIKDRLDDIQNQLDDIEQNQRRIESKRIQEKMLDELYKQRSQNYSSSVNKQPYRNTQSNEEKIKFANFYNLTVKQYIDKDILANMNCEKFDGSTSQQLLVWNNCYMASMIGVSMETMSTRRQKAKNMCSDFINEHHSEKKQLDCVKPYLVLGK